MTVVLGKDFKIKLGYIPRKVNDREYFEFISVRNGEHYRGMQKINEEMKTKGVTGFHTALNKPVGHEGLWVSPCDGDFSVWGDTLVGLGFEDDYADTYYEVIPQDDCRILNIDSLAEYIKFEKDFDFQWDLIAERYDMIFVSNESVMFSHFLFGDTIIKPKYNMMMYGWDCISGVFLNEKFTLGERYKYDKGV